MGSESLICGVVSDAGVVAETMLSRLTLIGYLGGLLRRYTVLL
jgi:hypothetical protein